MSPPRIHQGLLAQFNQLGLTVARSQCTHVPYSPLYCLLTSSFSTPTAMLSSMPLPHTYTRHNALDAVLLCNILAYELSRSAGRRVVQIAQGPVPGAHWRQHARYHGGVG
jgi:hypothetical protein